VIYDEIKMAVTISLERIKLKEKGGCTTFICAYFMFDVAVWDFWLGLGLN